MSDSEWLPGENNPTLSHDEIHVWRALLDLPNQLFERCSNVLSSEERTRASSFRSTIHKRRYIAGRGILRLILSQYIHIPPSQLQFKYNEFGKPFLADELRNLCMFNLSHSEDMALIAVNKHDLVGIDVERLRNDLDFLSIAQWYFSPDERSALVAVPSDEMPQAFFRIWTRKEAYVKATGQGLSIPTGSSSISLISDKYEARPQGNPDLRISEPWSLIELFPHDHYIAAAAVSKTNYTLLRFHWLPTNREGLDC